MRHALETPHSYICDHSHCSCDLSAVQVARSGQVYCCEACAAGLGCSHAGCDCGDAPEACGHFGPGIAHTLI